MGNLFIYRKLACGIFEDWRGLDVPEKAWQYAMDNRYPFLL